MKWKKFELESNPTMNGEPLPLDKGESVWSNNVYVVNKIEDATGKVAKLSLYRKDGKATHDWRDIQRIKNELAGGDAWFAEIYPAQSHTIDITNTYHLWRLTGDAVEQMKRNSSDGREVSQDMGKWQRPFRSTEEMEAI